MTQPKSLIRSTLVSLVAGVVISLSFISTTEIANYVTQGSQPQFDRAGQLAKSFVEEANRQAELNQRDRYQILSSARAAIIHVPDSFLYDAVRGQIVLGTDTVKCGLATSGYTYNRATHTKRSDVTPESSGTGYTAGGQAVTLTVTNDTTNHKLVVAVPTIVWPGSTTIPDARWLYCYKSRGGAAADDELVTVADFVETKFSSGGTFTVQPITLEYTHF